MVSGTNKISPQDRLAIEFDRRLLKLLKRGRQAINPGTGRPVIGEDGKVIMKPASSTDLETIRKRLHDCGLTRISKTLIEVSEDEEIRREIRQRLEAVKRN